MMAALHSASNTGAVNSIPMFHMSEGSTPRTQREFPVEVNVEHVVEVDNGSELSQDKPAGLANDRFVLSHHMFGSEKRKQPA